MKELNASSQRRWRISSDDLQWLPHQQSMRQSLPEKLGAGHSNALNLDSDLSFIETFYTPNLDLAILNKVDQQQPRLVVTLALQGHSNYISDQGEEISFAAGYTSITAFNSSQGERRYQADQPLHQLRLSMSKKWLNSYLGESCTTRLFKHNSLHILSHQPISTQGILAAQQLVKCDQSLELCKVIMHSQALNLLASELLPLCQKHDADISPVNPNDLNRVILARDILFAEYKSPPSVEKLARRVGTNQCKLKQLFHQVFNCTPYGLILDIRMKTAYQLLETSNCRVSEAADAVGYNHASNFSTAFIKYFGVSPKAIAKH